jgi:hypothetical protein
LVRSRRSASRLGAPPGSRDARWPGPRSRQGRHRIGQTRAQPPTCRRPRDPDITRAGCDPGSRPAAEDRPAPRQRCSVGASGQDEFPTPPGAGERGVVETDSRPAPFGEGGRGMEVERQKWAMPTTPRGLLAERHRARSTSRSLGERGVHRATKRHQRTSGPRPGSPAARCESEAEL